MMMFIDLLKENCIMSFDFKGRLHVRFQSPISYSKIGVSQQALALKCVKLESNLAEVWIVISAKNEWTAKLHSEIARVNVTFTHVSYNHRHLSK
jgi:hypothetical protein